MKQQKQAKQQKQKKQKNLSTDSPIELTFIEHVYELRKRLFWVVLALVLASALGFQIKDQLITAVMAPLHGQKLIYLTPGGGFSFIFTLSIYFGALLAIPLAIYHVYRFLQPLLGVTSRRFVASFMILSTLLATAGALFGYFVTIPAALSFLAAFAGDAVSPSLTADSYLSFVVTYILGLAIIFQLPLLLFMFDHVRPFPPGRLMAMQRYVIIAATILAAVITPTPDAINMAIVAIPIVVVYQMGAVAVFIRRQGRKRSSKASAQAAVVEQREEPLTEILQELESVNDTVAERIDIPQAFGVPNLSGPVPIPVAPPAEQQVRPRMVDGFAMRPQRLSGGVNVRSASVRPLIPKRPTAPTVPSSRSFRSIDGLSII